MSDNENTPYLTSDERRMLSEVLDEVIPPNADRGLPGAGNLGVAAGIEAALTKQPELRPGVTEGLAALGELQRARGAEALRDLSHADRKELLGDLATKVPSFIPTVVFLAFLGYYQHPRVLEALGLEGRPPFPRGYEVAPTDFAILDAVRGRASIYRKP